MDLSVRTWTLFELGFLLLGVLDPPEERDDLISIPWNEKIYPPIPGTTPDKKFFFDTNPNIKEYLRRPGALLFSKNYPFMQTNLSVNDF